MLSAALAASVTLLAVQAQRPLSFPGAEGAGAYALGGRGGVALRVTNLNDSGPGSLRAAVETEGPRTVIFDTGGTIRLRSPLTVRHGRITIAGQSAPGGGITLADQPLVIAADDVVVRFLRARLGDVSGVEADAISIARGRRIILDHVSASWSVDETLSVGRPHERPEDGVHDVTIQWSIISESLNASGHEKGDHGYGSLVRGAFGARIDFHHNLWASHRARMPRPGNYLAAEVDPEGPRFGFWSNVFYNWGGERAGYNADEDSVSTYAFVGNAYVRGPDSTRPMAFKDDAPLARAWFEGNSMDGEVPSDPWSLVREPGTPTYRLDERPDWAPSAIEPAGDAFEAVLSGAGASRMRDAVDHRIIASVRDRSGRIIDSQDQVGGWPELSRGQAWFDSDGDGMPDAWEGERGLDPFDAGDGPIDPDEDGYNNLEDWLNALAAERP